MTLTDSRKKITLPSDETAQVFDSKTRYTVVVYLIPAYTACVKCVLHAVHRFIQATTSIYVVHVIFARPLHRNLNIHHVRIKVYVVESNGLVLRSVTLYL